MVDDPYSPSAVTERSKVRGIGKGKGTGKGTDLFVCFGRSGQKINLRII